MVPTLIHFQHRAHHSKHRIILLSIKSIFLSTISDQVHWYTYEGEYECGASNFVERGTIVGHSRNVSSHFNINLNSEPDCKGANAIFLDRCRKAKARAARPGELVALEAVEVVGTPGNSSPVPATRSPTPVPLCTLSPVPKASFRRRSRRS